MKCLSVITILLLASSSFASKSPYAISSSLKNAQTTHSILRINIQDVQPHTGVCTYFVKRLEYLPSLSTLNLEVMRPPCLNDSYGKSQGDVYWVVPPGIQSSKFKLCVVVNDFKVATLFYDDHSRSFRAGDFESCNSF